MASGDVVLQVTGIAVSQDNTSGVSQQTVLSGADAVVPAPYPPISGVTNNTQRAATLGPVTLNVTRYKPTPATYPFTDEWPPETLFDTGKKYTITITEA